jgi:hypothetical protein
MKEDIVDETTLTAVKETMYGECGAATKLVDCVGANGFIMRMDQYTEHNMVNFMRDNSGNVIRDMTPRADKTE